MFLIVAQDIAHALEPIGLDGVNVPNAYLSLAGFEVTIIGRFWVTAEETEQPQSAVTQMSAIEKMAIAFNGSPSEESIKKSIDDALVMYKLPLNEDSRERAGSVLVALRQSTKVDEMAILTTMLKSPMPGLKFQEAAAFVATELSLKK